MPSRYCTIASSTARSDAAFSIDPDPVVAPNGEPERWITVDGDELLVRKVDVSHYCGDGAARWGLAIGDLVACAIRLGQVVIPVHELKRFVLCPDISMYLLSVARKHACVCH